MTRQLAPRPGDRRGIWPHLEGTKRADPRGDRDPEPTGVVTRPTAALPPGTPEHVLAQLAEHSQGVGELRNVLSALLERIGGPRALETKTFVMPPSGYYEAGHYRVPYAAVAVINQATTPLVVTSSAAQNSAPNQGQGQIEVASQSYVAWNLAGSALTIYGTPGAVVTYSALIDRVQPSAGTIALPAAGGASAVKQADTGTGGFVLQNATPTILTWTAPNDGNDHQFTVTWSNHVTVAETGGATNITWTAPDGSSTSVAADAGGHGVGVFHGSQTRICAPGTTVTYAQSSALTAGTASSWAQIWGI